MNLDATATDYCDCWVDCLPTADDTFDENRASASSWTHLLYTFSRARLVMDDRPSMFGFKHLDSLSSSSELAEDYSSLVTEFLIRFRSRSGVDLTLS